MRMTHAWVTAAILAGTLLRNGPLMAESPPWATKDLRAGIIGTDTSHVPAFTDLFRSHPEWKIKVTAAFKAGSPDLPTSANRVEGFAKTIHDKYGSELVGSDVLEGHLSTVLVHMANISYRLGGEHSAMETREVIKDRGSYALDAFGRLQEHLVANGVDFSKARFVVGPWLEMDPRSECFVGDSETVRRANELARRHYRKPFVVPENV